MDNNPFAAPDYPEPAQSVVAFRPVPCPACASTGARPAPYDAWHGRRAPKAVEDVICDSCGTNYNGEDGQIYPPKKSPLLWFLLALVLCGAYFLLIFSIALLG